MTILAERLKESKLTNQQHRIADYFLKNEERIGKYVFHGCGQRDWCK